MGNILFKYLTLECGNGKNRQSQAKQKVTTTKKVNCPMILNYKFDRNKLALDKVIEEHCEDCLGAYPESEIKRFSKADIKLLQAIGLKTRLIAEYLSRYTKTIVTVKSIHNYMSGI